MPVLDSANVGVAPPVSAERATTPNVALLTVRVGPVPAVSVTTRPVAPNSVWVVVPSSWAVTWIEVALSVTKFAIAICGLAIVTLTAPAPAVWPLSVYQPLTDPKLALKSPAAIPPEAALIVTEPVNRAALPVPVIELMLNDSVGASISTTPPMRRSPGDTVLLIVPVWPTNDPSVDSTVARKSPSGDPATYVEKCGRSADTVPVASSKLEEIATGVPAGGR